MLRGQQWWLEDLNSRNGTLLNDVPLHEATVVSPGDIITIGSTHLKIEPAF
jgi:pSer/pThr/pTyr-binding forkhead associated (FHA) protein